MTLEEKKKRIEQYCDGNCLHNTNGGKCPLYSTSEECWEYDAVVERNYELLFGKEPTTTNDVINHPSHYCREGAMESIEEMVLIFGKEAVKHFCLCNVHKYRYRASSKNGDEDLRKSDWYMKKFKELCDDGTATAEQIPLPI